ncbi:MAG TPA: helix-turn-helix domain-containing protein [Acidimicrobiales bacterium]|nr:helix-turn-helix domain-containing protein [Acidimicrobiales bacterium]
MSSGGRRQISAAATAYRRATRRLRGHLDEIDAGLEIFIAMLRQGESVGEVLLGTDASSSRKEFARAMADFESARHRLRVAVLQLGQEQGESIAELARALGISRQLAYRLLAEAE